MSFVVVGMIITVALICGNSHSSQRPRWTDSSVSELNTLESELPLSKPAPRPSRALFEFDSARNSTGGPTTSCVNRQRELPGLPLTRITPLRLERASIRFLAESDKDQPEDLRQYQSAGAGLSDRVSKTTWKSCWANPWPLRTRAASGKAIPRVGQRTILLRPRGQCRATLFFSDSMIPISSPPSRCRSKAYGGLPTPIAASGLRSRTHSPSIFFVSEADFMGRVAPTLGENVRRYAWFLLFDNAELRVDKVAPMLGAITRIQSRTSGILSHVDLTAPAYELLQKYANRAAALRTFLILLSLPVLLALLLYTFISSDIMVASEESDIATLKSRGASSLQIVGLYLLEMFIVGALCLTAGLLAASAVAQGMGQVYRVPDFCGQGRSWTSLFPLR